MFSFKFGCAEDGHQELSVVDHTLLCVVVTGTVAMVTSGFAVIGE